MSSSVRETSVTREELRRRTAELLPVLRERAARTEQLRQIPAETVQDLDAHAASHHQGLSWDAAAEDFSRQILGLPPAPGRYG